MKVVAAMSGGVDSAVAAARMVEAGHDVTGIHLALSRSPRSRMEGSRGCCSLEDVHDARRAADRIGIPFYVWDFSERFADEVIDPFVAEYAAGRTPNPCLRCNEKIKFAALLDRALDLGYDAVASGHYARLDGQETGRPVLRRARDRAKDQSYVLGVLTADQLSHCLFPLGEFHKSQVRAQAESLGLAVADKPDSTDICFIPDGDTAGWLDGQLGSRPGQIVEEDGTVVGHHDGHHHFTVGQRRGLHLGTPAPDGRPRYVLALEPVSNRVVVGPREGLEIDSLAGVGPVWCTADPGASWHGQVQVRAHGAPVEARFTRHGSEVRVDLASPLTGVAPGQAAVFYDDDVVVGSMTIATTTRRAGQRVASS